MTSQFFEIDLIFLIRLKRVFLEIKKAFLIIFKGFSVARNCLRPESASYEIHYYGIHMCAHHLKIYIEGRTLKHKIIFVSLLTERESSKTS